MGWQVLYFMLELFKWLIIIRVFLSWVVSPTSRNPLVEMVVSVTDPILRPLSRLLPPMGGLDLSPILAFGAIILLQRLVASAALAY